MTNIICFNEFGQVDCGDSGFGDDCQHDNDDFLTRQLVFLLDKLPAKVLSCKERLRNKMTCWVLHNLVHDLLSKSCPLVFNFSFLQGLSLIGAGDIEPRLEEANSVFPFNKQKELHLKRGFS